MEKKNDFKQLTNVINNSILGILEFLNPINTFISKCFLPIKNVSLPAPNYQSLIQRLVGIQSVSISLIQSLKNCISNTISPTLSPIFEIIEGLLKEYRKYHKAFHLYSYNLSKERENNQEINQILTEAEESLIESIETILFLPIPHYMYYQTFFENLVRSLSPTFPDYSTLLSIYSLVRSEITRVAVLYPEPSEHEHLVAFAQEIEELQLLKNGRRLFYYAEIMKFSRKKTENRVVLLLSDGIIVGENIGGKKVRKIRFYENGDYEIISVDENPPFINSIDIRTKEKSFRSNITLGNKSVLLEKFALVQTFEKAKWTDTKRDFFAPVWIQDELVTSCMICAAKFSLFLRRHHCRVCGDCICSSCSQKYPLPRFEGKPELVCTRCIKKRESTISKPFK